MIILIACALGAILLALYACLTLSGRLSREEEQRERERKQNYEQK